MTARLGLGGGVFAQLMSSAHIEYTFPMSMPPEYIKGCNFRQGKKSQSQNNYRKDFQTLGVRARCDETAETDHRGFSYAKKKY